MSGVKKGLFTFSPLMTCTRQQFAVLVFAHLLSSFFDHTAQLITPRQIFIFGKLFLLYHLQHFVH